MPFCTERGTAPRRWVATLSARPRRRKGTAVFGSARPRCPARMSRWKPAGYRRRLDLGVGAGSSWSIILRSGSVVG